MDKHYYSVPYEYIGKRVKLFYNQVDVEIYSHYERIARHIRDPRPFRYTTESEHLATSHRYITDWTPESFIERAEKVGTSTRVYITKVLEKPQHAEQAYRTCQGILSLAKRVGMYISIEINSINGQSVFKGTMERTSHQIDLSSFQKGIYIITIRSIDFVSTKRIIKL